MNTVLALKPALTALAVLLLGVSLLAGFLVAPLLLVGLVAAGMGGYERWNHRRRGSRVRPLGPPRSPRREVGTRRPAPAQPNFGFGSAVGRDR